MNIEIRGVNSVNKGAELMLRSIIKQKRKQFKNHSFVVEHWVLPYEKRAKLGLLQKLWVPSLKSWGWILGKFFPQKFKQAYGLVSDSDIDVIFDASGFSYSDQWGAEPSKLLANLSRKWKNEKKKLILLPQAFGPFNDPATKENFKKVIENADLIFARDKQSEKFIKSVDPNTENVKIAPDFTCMVKGKVKDKYRSLNNKVCIIPNFRMVKNTEFKKDDYLKFLVKCIQILHKNDESVFLLSHDIKDESLLNEVCDKINTPLDVIYEEDPILIKGIISLSKFNISSRYHGIISSLTQDVCVLGTGWSHKYQQLFEDFDIGNLLINDISNFDEYREKIQMLLDAHVREKYMDKIIKRNKSLKDEVEQMWSDIAKIVDN